MIEDLAEAFGRFEQSLTGTSALHVFVFFSFA